MRTTAQRIQSLGEPGLFSYAGDVAHTIHIVHNQQILAAGGGAKAPLEAGGFIFLRPFIVGDIALISALLSKLRDGSARDQLLNDKLDRNNEMARETRDTVRDMSRKLDDHGQTLARHTEQLSTLTGRVERLENGYDLYKTGGTD